VAEQKEAVAELERERDLCADLSFQISHVERERVGNL